MAAYNSTRIACDKRARAALSGGFRVLVLPSLAAFVMMGHVVAAPLEGVVPQARIAKFADEREAAISYTFDDNLRDQYTLAVPMLNEVGFKGTFFVIPNATAETPEEGEKKQSLKRAWGGISWQELKEMAAGGHEIASHTWSHPNLQKLPTAEVDAQFSKAYDEIKTRIGKPPLTVAFSFNASTPEIQATAQKYHVAYRAYQTSISDKSTVASLNTWADKLVSDKKWGVIMAHGVANGYAALSDPEIFRTHLKYVKSRERDIWVDTFANIARYEKERDEAKLTLSGKAGSVTCVLSSTLDPQLYDVPLTIVIDAVNVTSARAERAGQELPVRVDKGLIYVQAAPSPGPITVTWK
jgi:peptidoglycan/xylan/chitin deacetylase (PgdA/CDA1 family)